MKQTAPAAKGNSATVIGGAEPDHSTVLTLALDPAAQERFNALRQRHYPPHLNRIAAHVTLFHVLPADVATEGILRSAAACTQPMMLRIRGLRSLGRGVAFELESAAAERLHGTLSAQFAPLLVAQDRQRWKPHVVVQNKVSGEEARQLLDELRRHFEPWEARAVGLDWWDYLGGPWRLRERFCFGAARPCS